MGLKSKEVMELEAKVLVGTYARAPVVLSSGIGCKLYDPERLEYLDCTSGIAVNALGHGDPDWVRAVTEQAHLLTHVSNVYYSIPKANEAAIKFAWKFRRHSHPDEKEPPTEFISFTDSFHGRTIGALALASKEKYDSPFEPVMPGVFTFLEYGNIQNVMELIQKGQIAAVFVAPIQGEGGIYSAMKLTLSWFLIRLADFHFATSLLWRFILTPISLIKLLDLVTSC